MRIYFHRYEYFSHYDEYSILFLRRYRIISFLVKPFLQQAYLFHKSY